MNAKTTTRVSKKEAALLAQIDALQATIDATPATPVAPVISPELADIRTKLDAGGLVRFVMTIMGEEFVVLHKRDLSASQKAVMVKVQDNLYSGNLPLDTVMSVEVNLAISDRTQSAEKQSFGGVVLEAPAKRTNGYRAAGSRNAPSVMA